MHEDEGNELSEVQSIVIVKSIHFTITLHNADLAVLSVPNENIPKCAWWLSREYGSRLNDSSSESTSFHSLIIDDDGLSVVCDPLSLPVLQHLLSPEEYILSPKYWRAFVINVTGTAYEVPGAVYCLANSLSIEGLSILHISTFEAEVFLIQKSDLIKATMILKQFEDVLYATTRLDAAGRDSNNNSVLFSPDNGSLGSKSADISFLSASSATKQRTDSNTNYDNEDKDGQLDMSWITPPVKSNSFIENKKFEVGFVLCVLPRPVFLASINTNSSHADLATCANIIVNLLLFDDRFSPLEKIVNNCQNQSHLIAQIANLSLSAHSKQKKKDIERATFMWGLWQCNNEKTFLLEETQLSLFPPDCLIISPQQWRVIKLCGRPIAFDETGVVSTMSRVEANVPSLNISTVITNCTLVPDELLETTANSLSQALNCPIKYVE